MGVALVSWSWMGVALVSWSWMVAVVVLAGGVGSVEFLP